MKNTKRALRRHHQSRLKKKRGSYGYFDRLDHSGVILFENNPAEDPAFVGQAYATPCKCSCWMCGNRRKFEGLSFQEKRALAKTVTGYKNHEKRTDLVVGN